MKVFRMNDCDRVCANNKEEAIKWYSENYDLDEDEKNKTIECDIENITMWYGMFTDDLCYYLADHPKKIFEIKYDNNHDWDCLIRLTFKEVIELDNITEPQIIASTEY